MATKPDATYTYDDLRTFPEDNFRRELIDGELIVTAAPSLRHQRAVKRLSSRLQAYEEAHGGEHFPAPTDVFFTDSNVVQPDVLFVRQENLDRLEGRYIRSGPDIVVEVSSASTRHLEVVRKRDLYERFGVPEYWYVDLEADRVEIYRLDESRYGAPIVLMADDHLTSPLLPGFSVSVSYILVRPLD
jgi:Uma2 family endonuclease